MAGVAVQDFPFVNICLPYIISLRIVRKPCPCSEAAVRQLSFTNILQVDAYAYVFAPCELKVTIPVELFALETTLGPRCIHWGKLAGCVQQLKHAWKQRVATCHPGSLEQSSCMFWLDNCSDCMRQMQGAERGA